MLHRLFQPPPVVAVAGMQAQRLSVALGSGIGLSERKADATQLGVQTWLQ